MGQIQRGKEQAEGDDQAMPLEMEELDQEELHMANPVRIIKVALDSGAGSHVMSPADLEGYTLEPSPASIRGKGFVAASGGCQRSCQRRTGCAT